MDSYRKITVGTSLAVHAGAIALLVLVFDAPSGGAMVPAPQTMDLFLPPLFAATRSVEVPETEKPVEETKPVEVEPPAEVVEPEPVTLPVMAEAVEAIEPEVVVVKELEPEKPKPPKPKPRREAQKPQKPKEPPAPAPPSVEAGPAEAPIAAVATPGNADINLEGGGDPGARADYGDKVVAWIRRHKRYPDRAERREIEGTPWVRFVVDRNGKLISCALHKSSGRPELDQAALDTIARGDPFPAMPDEVLGDTKAFVVPIDFNIKKRR